ncbi:MAG: hypothetical protein ACI4F4_04565 [Lachnospiraceae bacterium]
MKNELKEKNYIALLVGLLAYFIMFVIYYAAFYHAYYADYNELVDFGTTWKRYIVPIILLLLPYEIIIAGYKNITHLFDDNLNTSLLKKLIQMLMAFIPYLIVSVIMVAMSYSFSTRYCMIAIAAYLTVFSYVVYLLVKDKIDNIYFDYFINQVIIIINAVCTYFVTQKLFISLMVYVISFLTFHIYNFFEKGMKHLPVLLLGILVSLCVALIAIMNNGGFQILNPLFSVENNDFLDRYELDKIELSFIIILKEYGAGIFIGFCLLFLLTVVMFCIEFNHVYHKSKKRAYLFLGIYMILFVGFIHTLLVKLGVLTTNSIPYYAVSDMRVLSADLMLYFNYTVILPLIALLTRLSISIKLLFKKQNKTEKAEND